MKSLFYFPVSLPLSKYKDMYIHISIYIYVYIYVFSER